MSNFKTKAAKHQLAFFQNENQNNLPKEGRAQNHWLKEEAAAKGRIFYEKDYFIFKAAKKSRVLKEKMPEWFYDTLRSQHIPYNFFIPLQTEPELCIKVINKLLGLKVIELGKILIEYPPQKQNPLQDKTSFDVFIECKEKNRNLFLGIEVKYTEGGYSPTAKEKALINSPTSIYQQYTSAFLYQNTVHLKENSYRQIWRNHILAAAFTQHNAAYQDFISLTIYPKGNEHFVKAIADFETFLTDEGKKTFKGITYEDFFQALDDFAMTDKQKAWIEYLNKRYLF